LGGTEGGWWGSEEASSSTTSTATTATNPAAAATPTLSLLVLDGSEEPPGNNKQPSSSSSLSSSSSSSAFQDPDAPPPPLIFSVYIVTSQSSGGPLKSFAGVFSRFLRNALGLNVLELSFTQAAHQSSHLHECHTVRRRKKGGAAAAPHASAAPPFDPRGGSGLFVCFIDTEESVAQFLSAMASEKTAFPEHCLVPVVMGYHPPLNTILYLRADPQSHTFDEHLGRHILEAMGRKVGAVLRVGFGELHEQHLHQDHSCHTHEHEHGSLSKGHKRGGDGGASPLNLF